MGGNVVSWERWGWKKGVKSFSEIDRERKARSEGERGEGGKRRSSCL